jgi:hypothetical protein
MAELHPQPQSLSSDEHEVHAFVTKYGCQPRSIIALGDIHNFNRHCQFALQNELLSVKIHSKCD